MFSFIIPTLGLSETFKILINSLINHDHVKEVIIIDNSELGLNNLMPQSEKIMLIRNNDNNYVNPSWNQGYIQSTSKKLAICNDDIIFDTRVLPWITKKLDKNIGIIGMSIKDFSNINSSFQDYVDYKLKKVYSRPLHFGELMFLSRFNYSIIPDDLKIACGDDYLFIKQLHSNYVVKGLTLKGETSKSSNLFRSTGIARSDKKSI